ncbi:type VII secretion target [Mycobacterium sp. NPDC003449]
MGEVDAARADIGALLGAARRYDTVADIVEADARPRLRFDGATAGHAHTAHGDAVRAALDGRADALREWARAAGEIAAVLRASADRYVVADAGAAGRMD